MTAAASGITTIMLMPDKFPLIERRGILIEERTLRKEGLRDFTLHGGHHSNVVRFLPPFILSDELAEKGIEVL